MFWILVINSFVVLKKLETMKYLLLIPLFFISCKQENKRPSVQEIIDKTIDAAGGENYENVTITFTFRKIRYTSTRKNGLFELTRTFSDSLGEVKDVLSNSGFERFRNGKKIDLPDFTATKYSNSVNSVHYFVQLPYGLNASSAQKELVGEAEIDGKKYYEIKVAFSVEGGGTDHEDVYMYWIDQKNFKVDYFAYKFYTDQGGIRFRKAYNPRIIEGLRFVHNRNCKAGPCRSVDLATLDEPFNAGKLELLSQIEAEDFAVAILKAE